MKELTIEQKAQRYDEAIKKARQLCDYPTSKPFISDLQDLFPELAESEDEKIRKEMLQIAKESEDSFYMVMTPNKRERLIAWLEKQGSEPNWCHHKVDLSDCSEEYRKAYYDGWNNCNMQHSQCRSESNDVIKCLINGMKFYYEDNKEATWGTEKFSMKVKDILSWLEKQGEQKPAVDTKVVIPKFRVGDIVKSKSQPMLSPRKIISIGKDCYWCEDRGCIGFAWEDDCEIVEQNPAWSEEDEKTLNDIIKDLVHPWNEYIPDRIEDEIKWLKNKLKSLRPRSQWNPSKEQIIALRWILNNVSSYNMYKEEISGLLEQLQKLRKE